MSTEEILRTLNLLTQKTGDPHMLHLDGNGSGSIVRRDGLLRINFSSIDKLSHFCGRMLRSEAAVR